MPQTTAQDPLVTIVVPAYNHGPYLAETIESVLAQDYPRVETIVIDDGSTDETAEVLARYADRVRARTQVNAGQATTINRGWEEAGGDIVSYLSADDRLLPHAISTAVAALARHPDAVMVYGDYALIDPRSSVLRQVTAPDFDYGRMVRNLVCAPGPGVFIRRQAAVRAGGWDPRLRQFPDFEYWLRLGLIGRFVRVAQPLAELRVHEGSTSFAPTNPERAEESVRIMTAYFDRPDLPAAVRAGRAQALSSAHLVAARAHLRAGRVGSAARSMREAGRYYPPNLASGRAVRLLVNAVVNRPLHKLLWALRRN